MNLEMLDPSHNIKGLSLRNVFDLGCSTIMEVKHKLFETCDQSAKKLFKSTPIIQLYQRNNWKAVCGALALVMLYRRSLQLQ